ncbi:MAG: response regulator [Rhodospirillales bacterium]|nr:response regulator [Rhodospirillales bacterium]
MSTKDPKNMTVLVIEDNDFHVKLIKMVLRGIGVNQVEVKPNGKEAMDYISTKGFCFDVIFCDLVMPEMNGLSVLEKVRSMNKTIPFVMVTAKSDVESVLAAKRLGVTAYVTKPFSPEQLLAKVGNLFGK